MEQKRIHVRCLLERRADNLYAGYSLEFAIAAQGDSLEDVREQLHAMIQNHLEEVAASAEAGNLEEAKQLLRRKARPGVFLKFHWVRLLDWLRHNGQGPRDRQRFEEDADIPSALA
ncbi:MULTISPECIES: hypothetical protein [unclassified Thioalkalivibrio]|uniref:hypothetical protein n=1 Tax=unclassified Thioalkalivibrio TaxID=2621013 RepID=UPI0003732A65|nr:MULTISPECIES: hypothetical protein [unclassified Thioalkalivibrio]